MAESHTRLARALSALLGAGNVRANERVARYTTWRVGGPAALLCVAHDARVLAGTVELVREAGVPWLVLGRGSNVLVDDAGLAGVVVLNRAAGLRIDGTAVHAESGVLLSVLARQTAARGLAGLEWCHDIPGTVGGAVVNNAGANGGAIADVLRAVRVLPVVGPVCAMDACELSFAYRRSGLRSEIAVPAGARPVVLDVRFELQRGD